VGISTENTNATDQATAHAPGIFVVHRHRRMLLIGRGLRCVLASHDRISRAAICKLT
jgi:hypothetical protein